MLYPLSILFTLWIWKQKHIHRPSRWMCLLYSILPAGHLDRMLYLSRYRIISPDCNGEWAIFLHKLIRNTCYSLFRSVFLLRLLQLILERILEHIDTFRRCNCLLAQSAHFHSLTDFDKGFAHRKRDDTCRSGGHCT